MGVWTGPAVLDALATQLRARGGLTGVTVYTAPPDNPEDPHNVMDEAIILGDIVGTQAYVNQGPKKQQDEYVIRCVVGVIKESEHDEDGAIASRNRAAAILGEVEDQLVTDPRINGTAILAHTSAIELMQGNDPRGRFSIVQFSIRVIARG